MSFGVTDAVSLTLHTALNGYATRQNVIADDIANVDTPGYRARSVDFESSLRKAIADGDFAPSSASDRVVATEMPTDTPVGANDNNVDLRKETMAALQTQYSYQMASKALTNQFSLLRTAAGGGA